MDSVRKKVKCNRIHSNGILGDSITIAVLDSGAISHKDYEGRIIGFRDFIQNKKTPYDDYGHGTHVTGILGGNGMSSKGRFCGMAPKSNLLIGKVLDSNGEGKAEQLIEGIRWVINTKDRYKTRILNISLGFVDTTQVIKKKRLLDVTREAWENGIIIVAAAGNEGPEEESITAPGMLNEAITVGCYGDCSKYSGRGSLRKHMIKPDLIAPGNSVYSCSANHEYSYSKMSGTSMATPVVAGACALLLSSCPQLPMCEVKRRIIRATDDCGLPRTLQGNGLLNLQKLRFT